MRLWKGLTVLSLLGILVVPHAARAQTGTETKATVPELMKFREVIYSLWPAAYTTKDTALMRKLWPDIRKYGAAVEKAELPGALSEKKDAWQKGLARLKAAEKAYGEALAKGKMEDKLKAAEDLHTAYEGLVLAIRPVIKELVAFQEVFNRIYHSYLPAKDAQAFKEALPLLTARMDTLNKAALPKQLAGKQAEFDKARALLTEKVQKVLQNQPCCTWTYTEKAVEEMHTAYQALEQLFD